MVKYEELTAPCDSFDEKCAELLDNLRLCAKRLCKTNTDCQTWQRFMCAFGNARIKIRGALAILAFEKTGLRYDVWEAARMAVNSATTYCHWQDSYPVMEVRRLIANNTTIYNMYRCGIIPREQRRQAKLIITMIVCFCDGLFQLRSGKSPKARPVRFLRSVAQLPIELQQILTLRAVGLSGTFIMPDDTADWREQFIALEL